MKEVFIDEFLRAFGKGLIIGLIGVLFPITTLPELILGLAVWIYMPMYDRYKQRQRNEKELRKREAELIKLRNNVEKLQKLQECNK